MRKEKTSEIEILASSLLNRACSAFAIKAYKENGILNHNISNDPNRKWGTLILEGKTNIIIYSKYSDRGRDCMQMLDASTNLTNHVETDIPSSKFKVQTRTF